MLIEFTVGNFRSVKDPITLNMTAANIVSKEKKLDVENVFEANGRTKVLKSAAVYGANASGKSNLVEAISFMRDFVLISSRETRASAPIDVDPFRLAANMPDQPSLFEAVFISSGKRYRYGFEVNKKEVVSEWLFWVPTTREARLFIRETDRIEVSRSYRRETKGLAQKTRPNALFLSVIAQFNGAVATEIQDWFGKLEVLSGLDEMAGRWRTIQDFTDERYSREIADFVKRLDLGINDIQVKTEPIPGLEKEMSASAAVSSLAHKRSKISSLALKRSVRQYVQDEDGVRRITISTSHQKFDSEGHIIGIELFDLDEHESEGTKKLFSIAGLMMDVLRKGKALVVDELDARLHPLITATVVGMFHSSEFNTTNAQLIFTTHDTNLLDNKVFRRDQIWFTEKDQKGSTHLHSLVEYKVRNDASYEKDYIRGKYGAIPNIGTVERLVGDENEQKI